MTVTLLKPIVPLLSKLTEVLSTPSFNDRKCFILWNLSSHHFSKTVLCSRVWITPVLAKMSNKDLLIVLSEVADLNWLVLLFSAFKKVKFNAKFTYINHGSANSYFLQTLFLKVKLPRKYTQNHMKNDKKLHQNIDE